jgi:hypothetical protein
MMDSLFGVLPKFNCWFFYVWSIVFFAIFLGTILVGIIKAKKKFHIVLLSSVVPLFAYYLYRLFYSMCEGSLP